MRNKANCGKMNDVVRSASACTRQQPIRAQQVEFRFGGSNHLIATLMQQRAEMSAGKSVEAGDETRPRSEREATRIPAQIGFDHHLAQ